MSLWHRLFRGRSAVTRDVPRLAARPIQNTAVPDGTASFRQVAHALGFIALGARMAQAAGALNPAELEAFRQVFRLTSEDMDGLARYFEAGSAGVAGSEAYAGEVARLIRGDRRLLEDLIYRLFQVAGANRPLGPAELSYLRQVALIVGLRERDFLRIRATHRGPEADDPYLVLGLGPDASDAELKRAWHELARRNHPDLLAGQGFPKESIELAAQRLTTINAAYERICKTRLKRPRFRPSGRAV